MHERWKNERREKEKESERKSVRVCVCMDIGGTGSSPAVKGDNPLPEEFDRSGDWRTESENGSQVIINTSLSHL